MKLSCEIHILSTTAGDQPASPDVNDFEDTEWHSPTGHEQMLGQQNEIPSSPPVPQTCSAVINQSTSAQAPSDALTAAVEQLLEPANLRCELAIEKK